MWTAWKAILTPSHTYAPCCSGLSAAHGNCLASLARKATRCLGLLYLAQGDLEPAIRVLEQGLALCRASGTRGGFLRQIVTGLGSADAFQGRLAAGRALLDE